MTGSYDSAVRILTELLRARTGQTLLPGRMWRVEMSLKPVLAKYRLDDLPALVSALTQGAAPAMLDDTIQAMLNNETYFFREHSVFGELTGPVLAQLQAQKARRKMLTIWHCGVSTGQEAYSMAMGFAEDPVRWAGWSVTIVGTDISRSAIDRARAGIYNQFEIQRGLSAQRLVRWFDQLPDGWLAGSELRRRVQFSVQNMLTDMPQLPEPPDLILCRNVMLYFDAETRRRAFDRLRQIIAPHGLLVLGAGETVLGQTDQFRISDQFSGFYMPVAAPLSRTG